MHFIKDYYENVLINWTRRAYIGYIITYIAQYITKLLEIFVISNFFRNLTLRSGISTSMNIISDRCGQDRVWKNLKINDKDHVICFTKENESWKVLLTNLIEIWMETLTDETVFHKCQVLESQLSHTYVIYTN